MHSEPSDLFGPAQPPRFVSKANFAKMVGLSKGRISQLIKEGLPVEPNGLIDAAQGRCWMEDNLDGRRRKQPQTSRSVRDRREEIDLEKAEIELKRLKGELIERTVVERAVFAKARAERDAWQTWPLRISAEMASALGVEEGVLLTVLRRAVRDELARLAGKKDNHQLEAESHE